MTAVDARLSAFRFVLEEQRRFRVAQLRELAGRDGGAGRSAGGVVADDVAHTLMSGAQFALGEIDAALQRIDTGRYGLCQLCGGPIGLERLEVLPMASLCIACQRAGRTPRGVTAS
jgi:RNA polymerase-binding transcription factor